MSFPRWGRGKRQSNDDLDGEPEHGSEKKSGIWGYIFNDSRVFTV